MKQYTFALALFGILPFINGADAQTVYSMDNGYYNAPIVKTTVHKGARKSHKSGGAKNIITNNFYYMKPGAYVAAETNAMPESKQSYEPYESKKYESNKYESKTRKYFLAHPFFQPLKGKFGSVSDLSYAQNNFKFTILDGVVQNLNGQIIVPYTQSALDGTQELSQMVVKEDISYGLSDSLSLVVMAQYNKTKTTFKDWADGSAADSSSRSGLDIFGIGFQNRFVDNDKWIAMVQGIYQHQKDTANTFTAELKAGYKIDRTTVYGFGRASYSDLIKGDIYGSLVEAPDGDWMILSFNTDVQNVFFVEGGMGVFSVLNKYITLNGELFLGQYDWHEQLNLKGAFGWQPGDNFSLNLYGQVALYDSAKDKVKRYIQYDVNPVGVSDSVVFTSGDYKFKNYNEWKIGVQAILYF